MACRFYGVISSSFISANSLSASSIEKHELHKGSRLVQDAPPTDSPLRNASGTGVPRVHSYNVAAAVASPAPIGLTTSTAVGIILRIVHGGGGDRVWAQEGAVLH